MSQMMTEQKDARLLWDVVLLERDYKISLLCKPEDVRLRIVWANRGRDYLCLPADSGPKDAPAARTIALYVDHKGTLRVGRIPEGLTLGCAECSQIQEWLESDEYAPEMIGLDEDGNPRGDPCSLRDPEGTPFIPWGHDSSSAENFIW